MDITKKASMGGYIVQKENRQNWVDTGAFEAKHNRITDNRDMINLNSREQAYRVKLNRTEREGLIAAIKARQSILRIGDTQQMGTNREEQVIVAQQIRNKANEIIKDIPAEMKVGPLRALVARILRKLPEKAYKYLSATVILSMALSACSAINRSKEFETGQAESPAATAVMPDSVSDDEIVIEVEPSVVATEIAQPIDPVEDLLSRYLAGEDIDVSILTQEEFVELSAKLAEKKNAERGINVLIFDDGSSNPAFIDPNHDNRMMEYDGNADLYKTIEMFVPIAGYDEKGNIQFEVDGQLVTIGASAGVKWGEQITEYGDPKIEWPTTDFVDGTTVTRPERILSDKESPITMMPVIMLKRNIGQIYVTGPQSIMKSTFSFFVPITDSSGHLLYAREVLVTGAPSFRLYKEGSDLEIPTSFTELNTEDDFYKNLTENWAYYIAWKKDQDYIYGELNDVHLDHYQGLVSTTDTTSVLLGEKQNDQDMLSVATYMIIKAKEK